MTSLHGSSNDDGDDNWISVVVMMTTLVTMMMLVMTMMMKTTTMMIQHPNHELVIYISFPTLSSFFSKKYQASVAAEAVVSPKYS